jgi:ArsR family transcriptional regulator, cadmium/lead-responsive transcriptional repressor
MMIYKADAMVIAAEKQATALKAKLFRGFSDPSRLAILEVLRDGPRTVGAIVAATGLSQPNVSNHLSCLRDCDLVITEQQGRYVHYQLADERVSQFLNLADELLAGVAHGVYQCTRYNVEGGVNGNRNG